MGFCAACNSCHKIFFYNVHQTITAGQIALVRYVSASSHFLPRMSLFPCDLKKAPKHNRSLSLVRVPSLPPRLHRCFLVCWQSLQMMMLFPKKAHITHLNSADHWVQQVRIPRVPKWLKDNFSAEWQLNICGTLSVRATIISGKERIKIPSHYIKAIVDNKGKLWWVLC